MFNYPFRAAGGVSRWCDTGQFLSRGVAGAAGTPAGILAVSCRAGVLGLCDKRLLDVTGQMTRLPRRRPHVAPLAAKIFPPYW